MDRSTLSPAELVHGLINAFVSFTAAVHNNDNISDACTTLQHLKNEALRRLTRKTITINDSNSRCASCAAPSFHEHAPDCKGGSHKVITLWNKTASHESKTTRNPPVPRRSASKTRSCVPDGQQTSQQTG